MKRIAGIILAGGQSRRFGEPKALAVWQGQTFIEHIATVMQSVVQNLVIISHADTKEQITTLVHAQVVEDIPLYKGNGPLAGIITGMECVEAEWYIITPCDTPNVSKEWAMALVARMSEECEAIVPIIDGRKQPLLAAYHHQVKDKLYALLNEEKRSMGQLLSQCNVQYVMEEELHLPKELFFNVNTKEEYARLQNKR
ncbi:molybdenum cofactor guanylyltransferase [Bacillus sp. DX1.1]|uniref:molybdenum cofactor guanylyltransferase n=1 Tax=unclassified Bacillus (in: firmicutes) TaxID=185979 RepID=UPI0025709288|nr:MULTISPECIES: molybdenum cofactor guanylyltransferase [unclassified Bacillus (in: firmicutes)]MDM5156930.1 molybdenum cofactor guanylyltransferase [Bacillus sp. DX1.1]WJE81172.1 molybdenum cofactor guanylyltransferase [Bacillus sp. DX3.1]